MTYFEIRINTDAFSDMNQIARRWNLETGLPADVTVEEVMAICDEIRAGLADPINRLSTDTLFTRREAEVWAVEHATGEAQAGLIPDAVDLYLSLMATERDSVDSAETIREHVSDTYGRAYETVKAATTTDQTTLPWGSSVVWLGSHDVAQLETLSQPDEHTVREVINRLLEEQ